MTAAVQLDPNFAPTRLPEVSRTAGLTSRVTNLS